MTSTLSEKSFRAIKEMGLTDYEAKVYVTLVKNGPMTANSASISSEVPYSRIYDVLQRLEQKGWIEIRTGERPKYYKAKAPSEVVRVVKIDYENKLKNCERLLMEELQPYYEQQSSLERQDVWIIRGSKNILAKVYDMLERVRETVFLSIAAITGNELALIEPSFKRLNNLGVKVCILTSKSFAKTHLKGFSKNLANEIRAREQLYGGGLIIDGQEVLIVLGEEGGGTL